MPVDGKTIPRRLLLGYQNPHGGEDARLYADARVCGVWVCVWACACAVRYERVRHGRYVVNTTAKGRTRVCACWGGPVRPKPFPLVRRWVGQRLPHDWAKQLVKLNQHAATEKRGDSQATTITQMIIGRRIRKSV